MKLTKTENYLKEGIKLQKLIDSGVYGLLINKGPTYDYMTVYDLEEAITFTAQGWSFVDSTLFPNILLHIYRDLKDKEDI